MFSGILWHLLIPLYISWRSSGVQMLLGWAQTIETKSIKTPKHQTIFRLWRFAINKQS